MKKLKLLGLSALLVGSMAAEAAAKDCAAAEQALNKAAKDCKVNVHVQGLKKCHTVRLTLTEEAQQKAKRHKEEPGLCMQKHPAVRAEEIMIVLK